MSDQEDRKPPIPMLPRQRIRTTFRIQKLMRDTLKDYIKNQMEMRNLTTRNELLQYIVRESSFGYIVAMVSDQVINIIKDSLISPAVSEILRKHLRLPSKQLLDNYDTNSENHNPSATITSQPNENRPASIFGKRDCRGDTVMQPNRRRPEETITREPSATATSEEVPKPLTRPKFSAAGLFGMPMLKALQPNRGRPEETITREPSATATSEEVPKPLTTRPKFPAAGLFGMPMLKAILAAKRTLNRRINSIKEEQNVERVGTPKIEIESKSESELNSYDFVAEVMHADSDVTITKIKRRRQNVFTSKYKAEISDWGYCKDYYDAEHDAEYPNPKEEDLDREHKAESPDLMYTTIKTEPLDYTSDEQEENKEDIDGIPTEDSKFTDFDPNQIKEEPEETIDIFHEITGISPKKIKEDSDEQIKLEPKEEPSDNLIAEFKSEPEEKKPLKQIWVKFYFDDSNGTWVTERPKIRPGEPPKRVIMTTRKVYYDDSGDIN